MKPAYGCISAFLLIGQLASPAFAATYSTPAPSPSKTVNIPFPQPSPTGPQFCEKVSTTLTNLNSTETSTTGSVSLGVKGPLGGVSGTVTVTSTTTKSVSGSITAPVSATDFGNLCQKNCPIPGISGSAVVKCEMKFKVGAGYKLETGIGIAGLSFSQSADGTISVSAEEKWEVSAQACSVGDLDAYLNAKKAELNNKKNAVCKLVSDRLAQSPIVSRDKAAQCASDNECTAWAKKTCAANEYIGMCRKPTGAAAAICQCILPKGTECGKPFMPCTSCLNGTVTKGTWPFQRFYCK